MLAEADEHLDDTTGKCITKWWSVLCIHIVFRVECVERCMHGYFVYYVPTKASSSGTCARELIALSVSSTYVRILGAVPLRK